MNDCVLSYPYKTDQNPQKEKTMECPLDQTSYRLMIDLMFYSWITGFVMGVVVYYKFTKWRQGRKEG